MKAVSKTILALSAAAALFGSASAFAAPTSSGVFNPFTVNAPDGKTFTADKITGNYVEIATFNPDGTFDVSLEWTAGQFVANGGQTALSPKTTGLGYDYGMYALYTASGTVSQDPTTGATTFTFTPGTGSLQLFLDQNADTTINGNPSSGTGSFSLTNTSDDLQIASGNPLSGQGTLNPSLSTCTNGAGGSGINCGSFGSTTSFALNSLGASIFTDPNPFYSLSMQSGQLNNFTPSGTQTINGSLDVVFSGQVPEPASLGLLGLGLLGLGVARRRKQQ